MYQLAIYRQFYYIGLGLEKRQSLSRPILMHKFYSPRPIRLWVRDSTVTVMYGGNERTVQFFHRRDESELSEFFFKDFTMVIITFFHLKKCFKCACRIIKW